MKLLRIFATRSKSSSAMQAKPPKQWREAATLMLVAPQINPRATSTPTLHQSINERESSINLKLEHPTSSSSTVKYSKKPKARRKSQVHFLLTTRSPDSPFMGRSVCFPGGKISSVDESKEWIELYARARNTKLSTLTFLKPNASHPPIYDPVRGEFFSKQVALRITAIRETFEETGILLCKPFLSSRNKITLSPDEIRHWQQEIHRVPSEFITFCYKYSCVPDVWSLTEWSNWHSPYMYGYHRYDTMFYMTLLDSMPQTYVDPHEVATVRWITAGDVVHDYIADRPLWWLPMPQFYEMFRLRNVTTCKEIRTLLDLRLKLGIERWLPIHHIASDGGFEILPGDDLYPKTDEELQSHPGFVEHGQSLEVLRNQAQWLHRIEFNRYLRTYIVHNIPNRFGHIYDLKSSIQ